MSKRLTNQRRSSLGGHFAGTGIQSPTAQQFDDVTRKRSIKVHRADMLPIDKFMGDKEAYRKYIEENSGEVITYNMKDLDKAPK